MFIQDLPASRPESWKLKAAFLITHKWLSKWIGGHHFVKNTLGKITGSGPNTWFEKVDWLLRWCMQGRNPYSVYPHWISRSVFIGIHIFLLQNRGGLPLSPELIPSLSKNQDLGEVRDCKVICGNMGWNDGQGDVSTFFLFVFNVSDFIESIRPRRSYWVLDLNKFLESKICRTFLFLREDGKCETSDCSLGELRAYCAYSSFMSSSSSPSSVPYFCAISWVRVGVSHVISLHCCSCWGSYLTQLSFIKKNLPTAERPAAHCQVTYSTSEAAVQFDACWIRKCDHSN